MIQKMVHIAVLMMVKNEKKRFHVTLESIKDVASSLVLYDTGSTDNTVEIAREFCKKHNIIFRLKEGEFVNFCESRNISLDFADSFEDIDYLLLLDCNDELRNGEALIKFAKSYINKPETCFMIRQQWWSGKMDTYFNVRFIKPRNKWRYKGVVHEFICSTPEIEKLGNVKIPEDIVLYQDRTQDDDKSGKRFVRDKDLLLIEYKKDPTEPRTVFYLAQTCSCLGQHDDALYYYSIRSKLIGFYEEVYHAYLRAGECSEKLGHDWHDTMIWYIKAIEHSERVEPLIKMGEYYNKKKNFLLAYTYLRTACELGYPDCILFLDKLAYDYKRWHLMGICCFYIKRFEEGKLACLRAIENGRKNDIDVALDLKNLKFYENSLAGLPSELHMRPKETLTKKQYVERKMIELKETNPGLTEKQRESRANMSWKIERDKKK